MARRLALYWPHLRWSFQPTLAPIFLWGWLLAGAALDAAALAAFVSLHLFLYPAATAFNAAHDRDEGPIGGRPNPAPPPDGLAGFAIVLALLGAIPAAFAGGAFLAIYAGHFAWSFAYSHPATRLKARPLASALAIALGQGALGFAAGWVTGASDSGEVFLLGAGSAALTALGLYPATQVFQVEEDRARGDRTLAVALGPRRALRFGAVCLGLGGSLAVLAAAARFGTPNALAVGAGYTLLALSAVRLSNRSDLLDPPAAYASAMRLLNTGTAAFILFLAVEASRML
jgi:4-hydroxybenzoate polyprenyltransferase